MALAYSTYDRMGRMLLKTQKVLGEGDPALNEENKIQALQLAASLYDLYGGDGSEVDYEDDPTLTILQSEMIATRAAKELLLSAISYYKDDVISAQGGPANAHFRIDKLDWLREQIKQLDDKLKELESANGINALADGVVPGLALTKVRACCDPADDVCTEQQGFKAFEETV